MTNLYNLDFADAAHSDATTEAEIFIVQRAFEDLLPGRAKELSIYEFRETFERYTGLTLETRAADEGAASSEKEIFRVSGHENKKLGEICLHRRNRRRLVFHQTIARRDFLKMVERLAAREPHRAAVYETAGRLFSLLDDFEANNSLAEISNKRLQSLQRPNVRTLEKDSWNVEKPQPSPASQISTSFPALTATAKLSGKD